MCGIAGIISSNQIYLNARILKSMADSLAHRGPDGEGFWINKKKNIGLAHRRLAIIDLSPAGAQPMHYAQRYSIVYNGEIYNYIELRKELKKAGYHFVSNSDTEVILAAYDCYKEKCVLYFEGMFAFSIWDESEQTLFAARDRFGEKPFYYYSEKNIFIFGSEMKALWAAGVQKQTENKMLLNYITLGYVQNPADKAQTFFRDIYSLPPAHYLKLNAENYKLEIEDYWNIDKQAIIKINEEEAIEKLDKLFSGSVFRRLRSDVPVGASLSGGLDSSTIIYYLKQQLRNSSSQYKTFSAVFPGFENDESKYIEQVSNEFNVESYTTIPSAIQLIDDFEKLAWHQEEPFPSASIYAQYKVFELAKQHNIKVLLDGQGADEILAGYHKYVHWYLQEMVSRYKYSGSKKEKLLLQKNNVNFKWGVKNIIAAFLPSHASIALEKKEYLRIIHHVDVSKNLLACLKGREWEGIHKPVVTKLNDILYFSTMQHGLQELLRYSDRNAMAYGREVRLPFLDAELVQFIFSLPSGFKINNGFTKSILRKLMNDKLPQNIVWRTDKIGYEPPQKQWMENQVMKDYIYEAKSKLVKEDILKPHALQRKTKTLHAHDADNFDWRYLCVAQVLNK
ncbi:MAG: asparagine synthase (glutamine-hydrolyzing) [Ferruginibacter sp.]